MTQGTFYELARARRALALRRLETRVTEFDVSVGRDQPTRLTLAAVRRLMQRPL